MKRWRWAEWTLIGLGLATAAAAAPRVLADLETSLVYPTFWHTPFGIHRGTQELLARFTRGRAQFAHPQGLACVRLLSAPLADGPEDCRVTVLGANTGQANLIYNPSLTQLNVLGGAAEPGLFARPVGVALAPDGSAFVTDPGQRRVLRLRMRDGRLRPEGEVTPPAGGWSEPWGVCLDSTRRLYVSDAKRGQIVRYSPTGAIEAVLGPDLGGVRLVAPRALAVTDAEEPWSYYHDNYLYVCDQGGRRLLRLGWPQSDPKVHLQVSADDLPRGTTPASFAWIALDYYENLWVTDPARGQVHKFSRHLRPLVSFGRPGSGEGLFARPTGIAIFRNFGQVFVAGEDAAHYFWIGTDVLAPQARWQADPSFIEIRFVLTEPSRVRLTVEAAGLPPVEALRADWLDAGVQTHVWRCPPPLRGRTLSLRWTVEATYSSASHFAKELALTLAPPPEGRR